MWAWACAATLVALVVYGLTIGQRIEVERVSVEVPGLTRDLRVVLLSDLHLSWLVPEERIRSAVELAKEARPDLVLLAGDYVTGSAKYAPPCARELGRLKAPLGTFAVLGNHDYWVGAQAVRKALQGAGIRVLDNQAALVPVGQGRLALVGISDVGTRHARVDKAFGAIPEGVPVIVLSHNPDVVYQLAGEKGVGGGHAKPTLVLSGHTHGGQVAWVGKYWVSSRFGRRHPSGLTRYKGIPVYVTRGVGVIMPPVRIGCRPAVTVFELRPGRADG